MTIIGNKGSKSRSWGPTAPYIYSDFVMIINENAVHATSPHFRPLANIEQAASFRKVQRIILIPVALSFRRGTTLGKLNRSPSQLTLHFRRTASSSRYVIVAMGPHENALRRSGLQWPCSILPKVEKSRFSLRVQPNPAANDCHEHIRNSVLSIEGWDFSHSPFNLFLFPEF